MKKGDKVAIVSPARSITFEEVHPAIRVFQRHNLEVVLGTHIFSVRDQFAGTDEQRAWDFQQMLDDESIRAIVASRGGYGTVRIIDRLNFAKFRAHPKWIVGYSDITVLHAHIQSRFGIETLHATMPVNVKAGKQDDSMQTLLNALSGKRISYSYPATAQARPGTAEGILVGGNLSVLYSLLGSGSLPDTAGNILFIEDLDEYLYHIDRMMMALKRAGMLERLNGLIVGGMSRMNDNPIPFGKSAGEIIAEIVKPYKFPVCFDFPAGHQEHNLALIMGRKAKLTVGQSVELSFY